MVTFIHSFHFIQAVKCRCQISWLSHFQEAHFSVAALPRAWQRSRECRDSRRQTKAGQIRIASATASAGLCQFSISETLSKYSPGLIYHTERWAGLGHCVTAVLRCFVQLNVLLNSDHGENNRFLSKSSTHVSSLCSLCSKATLLMELTSRDDPRKILR